MSHIAEIKTRVTDLNILKDILKELGFDLVDGKTNVKDMVGKRVEVISKAKGHEFGIQEVKGEDGVTTYNVTGEFYSTKWYCKEKEMAAKINRTFSARKIKAEMEALGYSGMENFQLKENNDGSIVFEMGHY
jgi:hypothetical protein